MSESTIEILCKIVDQLNDLASDQSIVTGIGLRPFTVECDGANVSVKFLTMSVLDDEDVNDGNDPDEAEWRATIEDEAIRIIDAIKLMTVKPESDPKPAGSPWPVEHTPRNYELIRFKDRNGAECSIQESSLATESCLWIGPDDADPKIMWKDAERLGYPVPKQEGWVPYMIPKEVSLNTRMHVTREQAANIVAHLTKWLQTGSL